MDATCFPGRFCVIAFWRFAPHVRAKPSLRRVCRLLVGSQPRPVGPVPCSMAAGCLSAGGAVAAVADVSAPPHTHEVEMLRAGTAWDIMRGGADHDMFVPACRKKAEDEAQVSCATLIAFDCKTMSGALDVRIPGAKRQPRKLRSDAEPEGLSTLMGSVAEKLRRGTDLVVNAATLAMT